MLGLRRKNPVWTDMVRQSFLGEQDSGGTLGIGRLWINKGKKGERAGGRRGRRWGGRLIGGLGMRGWIVAPKSGYAPRVLSREWRERGSLRVAEKEQVPARMMDWEKDGGESRAPGYGISMTVPPVQMKEVAGLPWWRRC